MVSVIGTHYRAVFDVLVGCAGFAGNNGESGDTLDVCE